MSWKGVAILFAVFGWFGGDLAYAEEGAKHASGGARHGCHGRRYAKPAPAKCAECAAREAVKARAAEIKRLREEIAKARQELASLKQDPAAASASSPTAVWLGVQVADGRYGRPEITGVTDGSPAAAAGLQKGDVLLLWGNQGMLYAKDVENLASQVKPGETACLTVLRGHAWVKAEVTRGADAPAAAPRGAARETRR